MMFLEYAIWGAWFVVLGQYLNTLNFTGKQIGSIYATMSLGGIISPIFFGAVADRYIPAQYVMGICHILGALLLFTMAQIRKPWPFFWVTLAYAMAYAPTMALSNAVAFAHIPDAQRDFPTIRVLGTIGWIAANLFLKVLLKPGESVNNRPLLLAAVLSAGLGFYSFFLPETKPNPEASALPFLDALALFKEPSFAVFFTISFLITIALAFYYSFTSLYLEQRVRVRPDNVGPLMTIGQWMEIFFLAGIPWIIMTQGGSDWQLEMKFGLGWFLDQFGMKAILIMGMAAWAIRYGIFALSRPFPLVILGLALHGICFDFFFAAGFIHIEKSAPAFRSSGQALYETLTFGLGMYLGTEASGWVNQWFTREVLDPATGNKERQTNWTYFWLVPCIGVIICLALFVILF